MRAEYLGSSHNLFEGRGMRGRTTLRRTAEYQQGRPRHPCHRPPASTVGAPERFRVSRNPSTVRTATAGGNPTKGNPETTRIRKTHNPRFRPRSLRPYGVAAPPARHGYHPLRGDRPPAHARLVGHAARPDPHAVAPCQARVEPGSP